MKTIYAIILFTTVSFCGYAQQLTIVKGGKTEAVLVASDKQPLTAVQRGDAKYAEQDYLGAIEEYNKAVEAQPFEPAHASVYCRRGLAKEMLGDKKAALDDYSWALSVSSSAWEAYLRTANIYTQYDITEKAVEYYTIAIELNPHCVEAYLNRAAVYGKTQNYVGQIADYNRVIKLSPDHADAYYLRGLAKTQLEQYAAAMSDFAKSTELNPEKAEAWEQQQVAANQVRGKNNRKH